MSAPSGLIDFHTHVLPGQLPALADRYQGDWPTVVATGNCTADINIGSRHFRSVDSRCWDPYRRLDDMARHGVVRQVLSPIPISMSYGLPAPGVIQLSRMLNEWIAGIVRESPGHFAGLGTIPLQEPDTAASMLADCVRSLGLAGVELGTHVNGLSLDATELDVVFAAASEVDATVFIHPWQPWGGERLTRHALSYSVGMASETAQAAASLVMGGVLDRYPQLKIVLAHGGGAFLSVLPRIDQCWEAGLCEIGSPNRPSSYATRFYYDTLVYDTRQLTHIARLVGTDRLVVGSDYPFDLAETPPGRAVAEAGFDHVELQQISLRTAADLLGLAQ